MLRAPSPSRAGLPPAALLALGLAAGAPTQPGCAPARTDRPATLIVPTPAEEARAAELLAAIDAAKEGYALSTYAAKSKELLAHYPQHPEVDRVRYELAVQLVAASLTATTSTTAVEARRLLAEHATLARTADQRFEAELLLLKLAPRPELAPRAEAILAAHPAQVDLDQVYLFVIAGAVEAGDLPTGARWAARMLERWPRHPEAPRLGELVRRAGLAKMPWDASELAGLRRRLEGKVVLVDFFASWCTPCLAELPRLRALHAARRGDDFELLSVSLDEDGAAYKRFVEAARLPWPVVRSLAGPQGLASRSGVTDLPTYFLVDRDGRVVSTELRGPALVHALDRLLGRSGP